MASSRGFLNIQSLNELTSEKDGFRLSLSRNFRGVSGSRYLKFNTWSRSSRPVLSDSLKVADDDELLPFPWDELFRV